MAKKRNRYKFTQTQRNQLIDTINRAYDTVCNIQDRDKTRSRDELFFTIRYDLNKIHAYIYENSI